MRFDRFTPAFLRFLATAALALLLGCGVGPGGRRQGPPPGTGAPEVLYAATPNGIAAMVVDTTNGTLNSVTSSPFAAGAVPTSLAVEPGGSFLHSVSAVAGTPNVLTFAITASTGALAPSSQAQFPGAPGFIVVDPSGHNVYVASATNSNQRLIAAFAVDATTHALTLLPNFPIATTVTPQAMVMDPIGRFVYVLGQGAVDVFARDATSGSIAPVVGSPFAAGTVGGRTSGIAVTPAGNFVLVTSLDANGVDVLSASSTGVLSLVSGSPFTAEPGTFAVGADPTGRFVYVANQGTPPGQGSVSSFAIDANGLLTLIGSPVSAGVQPDAITVDPAGHFVFVGNAGSNFISVYSINPTTGALTLVTGTPPTIPTGARALAVLPSH